MPGTETSTLKATAVQCPGFRLDFLKFRWRATTHVWFNILVDKAPCCNHHRNLQCCHEERRPSQRHLCTSFPCNLVCPQRNNGLRTAGARRCTYNRANIILLACLFEGMLLFNTWPLNVQLTVTVCTIPPIPLSACFNTCRTSPVLLSNT